MVLCVIGLLFYFDISVPASALLPVGSAYFVRWYTHGGTSHNGNLILSPVPVSSNPGCCRGESCYARWLGSCWGRQSELYCLSEAPETVMISGRQLMMAEVDMYLFETCPWVAS